jgi:hypothetical protein
MKKLLLTFLALSFGWAVLHWGGSAGCGGAGAQCGDEVISGGEICDGAALNGQTCDSQGFSSVGTLKCFADCMSFDTSACIQPGTLQGLALISGDAIEFVELAPDSLGNLFVGIHSSSTDIEAGGKSLTNTPPQPGIYHAAAAKINPDGSAAWLEGFEGNGTSSDNGVNFVLDVAGTIFFTGDYHGTKLVAPDRTLNNVDATGATTDSYAGRFNADGSIVWFDSFTSDRNDQVFLQFDLSGHLYVRGQFSGHTLTVGSQTLTNGDATANTADVFVEQVNPADGTPVWITHFSSDSWENVFPNFDSSGNVYVGGSFWGGTLAINGANILTNADASGTTGDAFVVRLDPSTGNLQWVTSFSSSGNDFLSVETDTSGNVYAFGTFMGTTLTVGGQTLTNADAGGTTTDAFAAKINSTDGSIAWLIPTLTLGAQTLVNADASGTSIDNFLGRLNPADGTVQWLDGFSGPGSSGSGFGAFPVFADPTGHVYAVAGFNGATLSFGGQTLTNADSSGSTNDAFIARFNADGTLAWVTDFSGSGNDFVDLGVDPLENLPPENVFVSGSFDSPTLSAGGQTLTNVDPSGTTQDAFVGMLKPTDGTFAWIIPISSTGIDYSTIVSDLNGIPYVSMAFYGPTITVQGQSFTNADASGTTADVIVGRVAP